MRDHGFRSHFAARAAPVLGALAACGNWPCSAKAAHCAAFEAAAVPFYACASEDGLGGFRLSPGGQASVGALRLEDGSGPFFLLSMDYEEGDRAGPWAAAGDFVLTLRWDAAGPRRGELRVEFCAPDGRPVPVRLRFRGPTEPQECGQWTTLLDGLAFPAAAARGTP